MRTGGDEAVRAANAAFYDAFETENIERMASVWEQSDRVFCTHPGWRMLRGWADVAASWVAIFEGPGQLQFILTNQHVDVAGDAAWVTNDENLLGGAGGGGTVAAMNLFVHTADGWKMIGHVGSPVV